MTLKLPNFLVVGAARCGTTYLYQLLSQHAGIFVPPPASESPATKDTHFFDTRYFQNGEVDIDGYAHLFKEAQDGQIIGEVATSYMYFEWVPELIANYLGKEIHLIFLLRNPIDRAYSHYWMELMTGKETLAFEDAINLEPVRLTRSFHERYRFSYVDRGFYMKQIEKFLPLFPMENMLFLFSEELYRFPEKTFQRICQFLKIDENGPLNLSVYKHSMLIPKYPYLFRLLKNLSYKCNGARFLWRLSRVAKSGLIQMPKYDGKYPAMRLRARQNLIKVFENDISRLSYFLDRDLTAMWQ